jgi:DNA-binding NarL/FixJ family response regulator
MGTNMKDEQRGAAMKNKEVKQLEEACRLIKQGRELIAVELIVQLIDKSRPVEIKAGEISQVLAAMTQGQLSASAIARHTKLSIRTVYAARHELWRRNQVVRTKVGSSFRWSVATPQATTAKCSGRV